jgi:hypothetical protein
MTTMTNSSTPRKKPESLETWTLLIILSHHVLQALPRLAELQNSTQIGSDSTITCTISTVSCSAFGCERPRFCFLLRCQLQHFNLRRLAHFNNGFDQKFPLLAFPVISLQFPAATGRYNIRHVPPHLLDLAFPKQRGRMALVRKLISSLAFFDTAERQTADFPFENDDLFD